MQSIVKRFRDKYYSLKRNNMIKIDSRNYNVQCYGNSYGGFNVCSDHFHERELYILLE